MVKGLRVIVNNVGFGILIVKSVTSRDGSIEPIEEKDLDKEIFKVQKFIPMDPTKIVLISAEGLPPSQYQIRQTNEEDWESLVSLSKIDGNELLSERIKMFEKNES